MSTKFAVVLFLVALLVSACGGGSASAPVGDAASGQKLFQQATIGKDNVPGCTTCHSVEEGKVIVGPSLAGIATDAAGSVKEAEYKGRAKDAAGWLRESILEPNVDIADGFQPNVMPQNFQTELTDAQVNDLVAYLMTLKK